MTARFDNPLDYWGEKNRNFLEDKGFGGSIEPGARAAILVIDLSRAFTDPTTPVGSDLEEVVRNNERILTAGRAAGVPIFFFTVAFLPDFSDAGVLVRKQPACRVLLLGTPAVEIDPRLAPRDDEPVIVKKAPSAFFGTNLASMLIARSVDTLVVTGCSTSACVRYTAVDGFSYGYRVLIPRDAVGDRSRDAHEASLHDLQTKNGEVVSTADVAAYLEGLRAGRGAPHQRGGE